MRNTRSLKTTTTTTGFVAGVQESHKPVTRSASKSLQSSSAIASSNLASSSAVIDPGIVLKSPSEVRTSLEPLFENCIVQPSTSSSSSGDSDIVNCNGCSSSKMAAEEDASCCSRQNSEDLSDCCNNSAGGHITTPTCNSSPADKLLVCSSTTL